MWGSNNNTQYINGYFSDEKEAKLWEMLCKRYVAIAEENADSLREVK